MSKWISVDDRLPDYEGKYLVKGGGCIVMEMSFKYCRRKDGTINKFNNDEIDTCWVDNLGFGKSPTHWMPLPEPSK